MTEFSAAKIRAMQVIADRFKLVFDYDVITSSSGDRPIAWLEAQNFTWFVSIEYARGIGYAITFCTRSANGDVDTGREEHTRTLKDALYVAREMIKTQIQELT